MQPGLNGSKGPDNSLKNTAIFDTMSWYWANHFPIVPSDYATNLLKIRLSDDVLKLAEDTSRDGEFFKMKAQLDEHWAWWVFPSFSQSYEKYDFDKPENIESGRCISRLILCSPEYINAYTKIIEYVANEIDNYRNNRAELESRFEKNVDFFKMLQCILNLYTNIPVVWDKCETAQVGLLVKFCDALKKFSDSMKAITSCKLRYGPEINEKNDINIKYIKALNEHDEKLKLQYLKEIPRPTIFLGLQNESLEGYMCDIGPMKERIFGAHMDRYSRKVSGSLEPFPEINKKFFGRTKIRNDYHYLIIKYYDKYLKNGGTEDIDEFLVSKDKKASLFYSCIGFDKIQAYNKVDAPSLLCFFNQADPQHRLNMIKECIEMEKKYDPPRTDIMSILIYEYLKTVKQEYIKELPYKGQLYIIKDFFPGAQVKNKYKYVEDNLITAILTKISERLNNNNFDKLANRNNLPSSVISEEDIPFRKYLIKYKQVDEERIIPNPPIPQPEEQSQQPKLHSQKQITQNSPIQPQINSFPVRKRYHDLMLKYYEIYRYPNANNIYEWINEASEDGNSVHNKWTNAKNTPMPVRNNLPLKNFIKPHQLVCLLNSMPIAKDRLYTIKDFLFFSEHIVDPELMAIIVNEYYSITQNAKKLYDLDTLLKYYLGGEIKIDPLFGYNTEEKIKAEMLEIKDILDKTDIENLHINDDDVANFEANKKALFDDNELRECHRRHHPPRQEHINLFEGGENIRKDLYFPIKKEFMRLWNLREQNDKIKKSFADIRNIGMFVEKMAKNMDTILDENIEDLANACIEETTKLSPAPLLCWFNNTKSEQSRLETIRKSCEVFEIIKSKIKQKQTTEHDKQQYAKVLATIVHEYYFINNNIQPSEQLQRCFDNYFGNGDLIIAVFMPTDHLIAVYEKEIEKINAELNKDEIEEDDAPTINDDNVSDVSDVPDEKNDETTKEKYNPPINKIPVTRRKKPTLIIPRRKRKKYTYRPKREAQKNKKEINRIARGVLQFFRANKNPNRRLNLLRAMIKNDEIDKNIYTPLIVCLYCYTLKNPQLKTMKDITQEIVKDSNLYGFGEQSVNYESKRVRKVIQYMEIIKKNFDTFSNNQILAGRTYTQDDLTPNEDYFQQKFNNLDQDENEPHQENENIVNNYDINNLNLFDKNGKIMFKNLGDLNEFFSEKENHAWEEGEDKSFNLLEDIKRHQISINSRINFVEHSVVYHIYNCRALYCWFEKHTDPEERLNVIRNIYNCLERKSYQEKKEYKNTYNFISYMFLTTLNDGDPRSITALNAMMEIIQKGDKITEKDAKRAIKIKERIMTQLKEKTNDELIGQSRLPRIERPNNKTNKNFLDKKRILSNNRQEKLANAIQNGLLEIQQQPNRRVENQKILQNLAYYAKLIRQAITT